MNSGLANASTTRKRNYDDLIMVNLLNDTNTMNEVDFNITKFDSDDKYTEILLQNLLGQFEADAPAKIQVSHRQMRAQRETTAKILKVVQEILLTSTIESDVIFDEYVLCACKELRMALEILIDRWGLGDIQICSSLVKTLLLSYLPTPTLTGKRIFQQKFILLDLLPLAAAGDSDNCRHLQSVIANALMQVLPKCGKNCCMYRPIICWCEWYLNHHQYYKLHSTLRNESSSNNFVTVSFVIPEDIYQLGLQLLRSVPSIDLLPSALSVNLDFFAVTSKTDFDTFSWLKEHTKELIVTLRQRWTELIIPRNLISRTPERDESAILDCQLQLLNLFENAVLDKDIKQECLLIDTYVKLLQVTSRNTREISELHLSFGTPKRITKRKPDSDSKMHVDSLNVDVETNVFTLDWIFVMMLLSSKKYKTTAINIVDTWCIREAFDSLSQAIDIMFMNQCTHKSKITEFAAQLPICSLDTRKRKHTLHCLLPCLLRMTSVLLLKPQRDYLSYYGIPSAGTLMQFESDSSTKSLTLESRSILAFFVHFDYHRQKELINMLLHVTDECLFYSGVKMSEKSLADINFKFDDKNKGSYVQHAVSIVVQKVFTILQHIIQSNPLSMHLKRKLMERLNFPAFNDAASLLHTNVDREICNLLVSVMRQSTNDEILGMENDCTRSDVLMLLHKLLFSESCRSSTTYTIRGMFLATELLSTNHSCIISIEERKSIQEWVLRRLLPCARRMIEPEVGLTGLSILNGWIDADPNEKLTSTKSSFFRHIKMMVANTGLVQVLNNYRRAGILKESKVPVVSKVILAYCAHATQSRPTCTDQETQRAIFLGLNFFLRRTKEIIVNPSRWSPTADWVFALIDTYLQTGRSRVSKGWNPLNWLRASMEFPTIDVSFFNPSKETQRLIIEFIDKNLCQFELSKGIQDNTCFPGSYADVVVSRLFSKKLKVFIDSLSYFAAALLIGISLCSAVLKNAYEHAQSTRGMSHELKKFMTLQIIKIYDLRAKSTTMDSLFLSINAALRRSLLRKKRATVVLSDDSSDDGTCSVVSSSRGNQGNAILHNLGSILKESRTLRRFIFTDTQYIGSELLWSVLKDASDSEAIRKILESQVSCKTDQEARQTFLKLSHTVGTKLHIIKQILNQLENNFFSQNDTIKTNVQHCFNEISFSVSWLDKLQEGCAVARNKKNERIVLYIAESLSLMVQVTSSYLQVIALFIRKIFRSSHFHRENGKYDTPDRSFNECFVHFDAFQSNTGESDGSNTTPRRLFNYFTDHLLSTVYSEVANSILENLSILAHSDDHIMNQLFDLSWVHLHSVYVHIETKEDSQLLSCPFAVALSVSEFARQSYTIEKQSNARIVKGIITKLVRCIKCYDSHFLHLHVGMIRHWGILTASGEVGFPFLLRHLATLGTNLNALLESFDVTVTRKTEILDIEYLGKKYTRMVKPSEASLVVGLDASTFPEFFETLLNLVIATAGTMDFGQRTNTQSTKSDDQPVIKCFGLFRSLMDTYKDHINYFPNKSAQSTCFASNDLLQIAVCQVHLCVEWQMDKQLLSTKQQTVKGEDVGAFCKECTDLTLSYVTSPILSLCDIWQKSKAIKNSKLSSLRLAVEKAVRQIKDISHLHIMYSGVECDKLDVRGRTETIHASRKISTYREQSVIVLPDTSNATDGDFPESTQFDLGKICIDDNDDCDGDNSFGVMGYWGDGVNVDNDDASICSLNIENPASSVFSQKTE